MAAPPSGTVTLLFSDIEGSTRLLRRTGPAYPELLERHRTLLREAFERHGGRVLGAEGDEFFVVFDSAGDAAAAAVDGQRALAAHDWPAGNETASAWACTRANRARWTAPTWGSRSTRRRA
jgi:class 3 adenylate cyclase